MAYEPSFDRDWTLTTRCMEIAELVGMLSPLRHSADQPDAASELRIQTIYSLARHRSWNNR